MKNQTDIRPYIAQFYKGNRICFSLALCETVLSAAASLVVSWLLQQILDLIGGYDTGFSLVQLTWIAVLVIVVALVTYLISSWFKPRFITRGISQYKNYIFEELSKKNITAFSGENTSTYLSALTNDIQAIEKGYLSNTFTMISSVLTFGGAIALMLWYSPFLTLVAILLSLLPVTASLLAGDKLAQEEKKVSDQNESYTAALRDSLSGFSVVKSFKAERQMMRLLKENVASLAKAQCKKQKTEILIQMLGMVAGVTAQLGVFLVGAYLALSGKGVTAGATMVFVQLMNFVLGPLGTIPVCLAERKAAKELILKIAEALGRNVRNEQDAGKQRLNHSINLNQVHFRYHPEKPVLQDINCTFEVGKKYAIVGASGSGKSTLLHLLMAAQQDYEGSIYYDETELGQIGCAKLYEMESIIQQNVFIFNATILENITMFREFPKEQVEEVIKLAGLSALIEEKGSGYLCGENGSGLSGGEKQRISIARSLLKRSQILLVDEATASLDAQTAYQVSNAILDLKGIMGIVVTHALDAKLLRRYDGILALKNGRIVESGTFDELMKEKGYFYSLYTISQ